MVFSKETKPEKRNREKARTKTKAGRGATFVTFLICGLGVSVGVFCTKVAQFSRQSMCIRGIFSGRSFGGFCNGRENGFHALNDVSTVQLLKLRKKTENLPEYEKNSD